MLNLMRKHASSWIIKLVLFAIVVVFVLWGVGGMGPEKGSNIAEVNGEVITYNVFRQAYINMKDIYGRVYGGQMSDAVIKEMAVNQLVERLLLTQEADRLNIDVAKEELAKSIRSMPTFQNNGAFDYQRYTRILAQNNLSPERYEADKSDELVLQKLNNIVVGGISVSDVEAREWYNWSKAKVSIEYALFSPDAYKDVQPTDEQVQAFFDERKDNYRTEAKIKARYIHFAPEAYRGDVTVTAEEISDNYNQNLGTYKMEKRVKARHILFKTDAGGEEKNSDAKKAEAMKVYEEAKAGEDFAELAKKYSEGPTREKGGDLGWFTRNKMVQSFADKAFSMKKGEISQPVQTNFGWHVIKVEDIEEARTKPLEEVEKEIRTKLESEKTDTVAFNKAEALYNSVFDGDDLAATAKDHGVSIQETALFTAKGPSEKGILQKRQFAQAAFALEKMAISKIQEYSDGYYILQVMDRVDAKIPEFDQVADRVKADVLKDQQRKKAKADAEAFLAETKKGKTFAEAGSQFNVTPAQTALFDRNSAIPQIGNEQQINKAAFGLTSENPLPDNVFESGKGVYVIGLKERQAPGSDDEAFGKEKDDIVKRLTDQKRRDTYQKWVADLKGRSDIKIYRLP